MTSRGFAVAIVTLLLGLGLTLTGCAQRGPSAGPSGQDSSTPSQTTGPSSSAGQSPLTTATSTAKSSPATGGSTTPDGAEDPKQTRIRTGPVASFGGPAYGDQGTDRIGNGMWCDTIQVFWGGAVPAGVTFRFDRAVTKPSSGLDVRPGTCGTKGADRTCLGLTFRSSDKEGVTCSIVLRPRSNFREGTTITFEGTLTCPTSAVCNQVAAREVTPGPPIVVTTPSGDSTTTGGESTGSPSASPSASGASSSPSPSGAATTAG
ncbi:hypothetical protein GA0111570_11446 [Raineyella antarctica]|uniref:Uncharacterized protein n=1 Tax=Raineyella antarctica TaxID=1577474 RepID=A0A1G6I5Z2_9ACTN|nr:hypothetical protein GA0111570_11446 [Raineyella antarctica]